jgi:hypothetical protein
MLDVLLSSFFAGLAVWRLAHFVIRDDGPFYIFRNIRLWVFMKWGEESWQYEGIGCIFCQTVWYSLPFSLYLFWTKDIVFIFIGWMAIATMALFINRLVYG